MSEQRLIDANALDSALLTEGLASALIGYPHRRTLTVGEIRGILQKAPTIPAEIVVHCRECKHGRPVDKSKAPERYYKEECIICTCENVVGDESMVYVPTHYCSYGERREDGKT